jgi:hypothetical protein
MKLKSLILILSIVATSMSFASTPNTLTLPHEKSHYQIKYYEIHLDNLLFNNNIQFKRTEYCLFKSGQVVYFSLIFSV